MGMNNGKRFLLGVHIMLGAVLFAVVMYPVLSSAQTNLRERIMPRTDEQQDRREAFSDRMQTVRQQRSEQLSEHRAQLEQRLKSMTSEQKAAIALRLSEQMNSLNERLTNHYLDFLAQLQNVLAKISERADAVTDKDVTAVKAKITSALDEISEAKELVLTQQAKVYKVTLTSEAKLREAYQSVKKQLQDDHAAMRQALGTAKEAVRGVFEELKTLIGEV